MKAIRFILLTCALSLSAHLLLAQTTAEEYNYLTKGYKIQIESGLDMKAGYTLVDKGNYQTSTRSCVFKALMKKGSTKPSGTLCIFHALHNVTYYFCIPADGSPNELWNEYYGSLKQLDNAEAAREYAVFVSELYSMGGKASK